MLQGKLALTIAVLATLSACAPKGSSGNNEVIQRLPQSTGIIAGKDVETTDPIASTIVAVYDTGRGALCTGSLLPNNIVLTAAHCVANAEQLVIVFGVSLLKSTEATQKAQVFPADIAAVSPYWAENRAKDKDHGDIALVHFVGDVPAGYKPATLLTNIALLKNGGSVLLAGYGVSDGKPEDSSGADHGAGVLRKTSVNISDVKFSATEITLDQSTGTGACHGDSGGPAYVSVKGKYLLWGVTSRGQDDEKDDCSKLAVYTNILPYSDWISETADKITSSLKDL